MKPIDNMSGVERVVSTLLGKTAETLTTTLVDKLTGRPRKTKRRRARQPAAGQKGGLNHG